MSQCLRNLKPIQRFNFGAVCVFAFLSTLLFSFVFASSASALGVISAQTVTYSRGHLRVDNGSGGMVTKNLEVPNPSMGAVLQHFNTSAQLNGGNGSILGWTLETNEVIPANSLISFYVQYEWYVSSWAQTTPPLVTYYGVQFANDKTLVSENCIGNSGQTLTQSVGTHMLSCTYLVYNSTPMQVFDTLPKQRIIAFTLASNFDNSIRFSNASYIQLSNDGLSASDRAWLEDVIGDSSDSSAVIAKLQEIKTEQQATTNAVRAQTQQQHDDYENEVEREEAKEEELNEQKDDLNLSAQATANPFANLFNFSGCVNMPTVGGWFNNPNLRVCSPYPSTISGILNFVGSAVICGFLIRIYYKHMQGGFNG